MNFKTIGEPVLWLLLLALMSSSALLLRSPSALRDDSSATVRPYSYARVQLWWWTLVILGSWIVSYAVSGELWQLPGTCLALLGVSAGTTTAARVVDLRDLSSVQGSRHQDTSSQGFFLDILSDANGVSIHRFQALFFNVTYTVFYLDLFLSALHDPKAPHVLPKFDDTAMLLLGVSASAYVAVKATENSGAAQTAAASSDELLDPDPDTLETSP